MNFEQYCSDMFDLDVALMSSEQFESCKKAYSDYLSTQKPVVRTAKQQAAHDAKLAKAKEARKLAKFYGGKALKGTAAQKKWAEEIRESVLASSSLTDDQKIKLVTESETLNKASFWINNKHVSPPSFIFDDIAKEVIKLNEVISNSSDKLRSNMTHQIESAINEIYKSLVSCKFNHYVELYKCEDLFDNFKCLIRDKSKLSSTIRRAIK